MTFRLISDMPLTFAAGNATYRFGMTGKSVIVPLSEHLGKAGGTEGPLSASDKLLAKMEPLLLAQQQFPKETKRPRLLNSLDSNCKLLVTLLYGAATDSRTETGYIFVGDWDVSSCPLYRLAWVCGGDQNLTADLELEFGTANERMKLDLKDNVLVKNSNNKNWKLHFDQFFMFPQGLAEKWEANAQFGGTMSVTLKMNDDALNIILLGCLPEEDSVNRKLLEDAGSSGDVSMVAANGASVRCHKIFLTVQSEVFKTMFASGMKEATSGTVQMSTMTETGIHAMLAYLYCRDIRKAVACSGTAVELLLIADKYGITNLFETMKEVILVKEDKWFSVASGLQLMAFGKNKAEEDPSFKEVEKKAASVLKSKSADELKECAEFRELFYRPDTAMEMCLFLMQPTN